MSVVGCGSELVVSELEVGHDGEESGGTSCWGHVSSCGVDLLVLQCSSRTACAVDRVLEIEGLVRFRS